MLRIGELQLHSRGAHRGDSQQGQFRARGGERGTPHKSTQTPKVLPPLRMRGHPKKGPGCKRGEALLEAPNVSLPFRA